VVYQRLAGERPSMFPISHSTLDARALAKEIDASYDLGGRCHCELLARGVNDIYLVRAAQTRFVMQAWRSDMYEPEEVLYELEYMRHLDTKGIHVASPQPTANGALFFSLNAPEGARPVALFAWAEGAPLSASPATERAADLGAHVAKLHAASAGFAPTAARFRNDAARMRERLPALLRMVGGRPGEDQFYRHAIETVANAMDALGAEGLPRGPTHGDIQIENILVSDAGRMTVIDFDDCGEDHLMNDLACFLWRNEYQGVDPAIGEAFVQGYSQVRPLTEREQALMPLFIADRDLYLAVGIATMVNVIGHSAIGYTHDLDWYRAAVERHMAAAGLS